MLRVILLISVLYTARAFPVSGDNPDPSRYTLREEEFEFGNNALEGGEQQNSPFYESQIGGSDEYEYYPYDGYQAQYPLPIHLDYEYDFASDESIAPVGVDKLIDSLEKCEENEDGPVITEEGCIYFDDEGNVHLNKVVVDDIDDANKMLEKAGLENCDMDGYKPLVPVGGCAYVSKDGGVHFMGVYKNEEEEQPESLTDVIGRVKPCKQMGGEPIVPPEGCVWFDEVGNIHLFNVLDDGNREDAIRVLHSSKLYQECVMEEDGLIVPKGGCIFVYGSSIHILGMQEHYTTHDDDEENLDYEDYEDYIDGDEDEVSKVIENLIGRKTAGNIHLQKSLFNRQSDDLVKKSANQKKIIYGQKAHKNPSRKPKKGRKNKPKVDKTMKVDREPDQGRKGSSHKEGNW